MNDNDYMAREKTLHQGPLPKEGMHAAVCALVEPVGLEPNFFEPSKPPADKVWICWELDEAMTTGEKTGQPFMLSKKYTKSLHENATLRADLVAWRKRQFTSDELAKFDLRNIIGVNCNLLVAHHPRADGALDVDTNEPILKAVIMAIMPATPGASKLLPQAKEAPQFILKSREENAKRKPASRPAPVSSGPSADDLDGAVGPEEAPF